MVVAARALGMIPASVKVGAAEMTFYAPALGPTRIVSMPGEADINEADIMAEAGGDYFAKLKEIADKQAGTPPPVDPDDPDDD